MSIRTELASLVKEKERLERQKGEISSKIRDLETQKIALEDRAAILFGKISPRAEMLKKLNQEELEKVQNKLKASEAVIDEIGRKIIQIQRQIDEKVNSTKPYIEEQTKEMVASFLEYVGTNIDEIAFNIQREFELGEQLKPLSGIKGRRDYIPTGVMIVIDDKGTEITKSQDFYFEQRLFEMSRDGEMEFGQVINTKWYNQYLNDFRNAFFKKLTEGFCYADTFKLTVEENSKFTLELV